MALSAGTRLGPYEIISAIGAGGMGEVYKARDTRLNRDVAIKTLPDLFAQDAERVARFTREAQTLAALNHPNIAQIYGIESNGLVMELVDGEDLSALIARPGAPGSKDPGLHINDALAIARQIADALEAAHEQGIVHRDLKPANVKVRADGTVKVLDFGLAKAFDSAGTASGSGGASPSNSPTLTAHGTHIGMILGTAAYMAPEQARGKVVDRRADIWAFGVVLFEMLTGRRLFSGDEISDVLAAVLRQEIDFTALPETTPAAVRRLLKRCLERDPRKRLSAIGDARLDIDEPDASSGPSSASASVATASAHQRPTLVSRLWPALAGIALTTLVAYAMWTPESPGSASSSAGGRLARLAILAPPGEDIVPDSTGVAISPDGTMVAFVTGIQAGPGESELWVRSLDSKVARRLDDVSDVALPFWSPDSRRIAYSSTAAGKLKTIAATGGRADIVATAQTTRGGVWTESNILLFAGPTGPLLQVAASGGTPTPVTILDATRNERNHRFPALLPDKDHFLYVTLPGHDGKFDVFVGSLSDTSHKTKIFVGAFDAAPTYAQGHLLYSRQGVLAAVPFDLKEFKTKGDPILLEDEPFHILDPAVSYTAGRSVTVSTDGSLAYYAAASNNTVASWIDTNGAVTGTLSLSPGYYDSVTISPDGTRGIAVRSTSAAASTLWLVDLQRGTTTPFSTGPGRNDGPLWSPDSTRALFSSDRSGPQQFFTRKIDDAAPETEWYSSDVMFKTAYSFSPDKSLVVMNSLTPKTMHDISVIDASGKKPPTVIVSGPLRDIGGWVSPDGKWLAYASETSGSLELWVQSFPDPGRRVQISERGSLNAWWTPGTRQLVWVGGDSRSLWRADVVPGPTFSVRTPVKIATLPPGILSIDAMPDRQRFLAIMPERSGAGSVMVVQNWIKALDAKK